MRNQTIGKSNGLSFLEIGKPSPIIKNNSSLGIYNKKFNIFSISIKLVSGRCLWTYLGLKDLLFNEELYKYHLTFEYLQLFF